MKTAGLILTALLLGALAGAGWATADAIQHHAALQGV